MTEYTHVEMDSQPQASPRRSTEAHRQEGSEGNVKMISVRGEDELGPYTDTFNYPVPGAPAARA